MLAREFRGTYILGIRPRQHRLVGCIASAYEQQAEDLTAVANRMLQLCLQDHVVTSIHWLEENERFANSTNATQRL